MRNHLSKRLIMYFLGLFTMTIGVALSVKSDLGVSPVSSIPYTMTCIWGIEMGKATIIFHCFLVLLQMILLRRNFKPVNLLQVLVGIVFGYFTTFCNWGVSFLPTPENLVIRLLMMLISTVIIAFGIFMYLPPNIMPLAGEGAMKAVSDVTGIAFPKVKVGFDITMVVISLISCLIFIKGLGSVGIGTIIAAFLVGSILNVIENFLGNYRDKWLGIKN
ncbi:YczE/YyaS/YitT family protein [Streptococcus gallolyticus]|uniref:YczE/YyaS/YitT family protein n=1 Tax=Streptococcus gallolyticus TaxID=315405 RepID=UPI003D7014FF